MHENELASGLQIRPLTASDLNDFRDLRLLGLQESPEAFGADYDEWTRLSLDDVAKRIERTADAFVLGAFAPRLVGIAGCQRRKGIKLRHTGEIWGVYVHPSHRRERIGRSLMQALIQTAAKMSGLERLVLTVVTENTYALRLYQDLGFRSFGCEPRALRVHDRYIDEENMVLDLL